VSLTSILTILFCNALFGLLCAILARKRGLSAMKWFWIAVPLGALALFSLLARAQRQKP
jgi:hypothetical protein